MVRRCNMDWDEYDSPGYYDFMDKPLGGAFQTSGARFGDEDEGGYHFSYSTINADGDQCVTWQKSWTIFGAWILREKHGKLCPCSYCEKFDKRWGIVLPECRCRNAWRILYWRKAKWPCELSCIRITLPSFMKWRCRRCRKNPNL